MFAGSLEKVTDGFAWKISTFNKISATVKGHYIMGGIQIQIWIQEFFFTIASHIQSYLQ